LSIDGKLKPSWNSFLLPPAHRSIHQHKNFAQLGGDLPILFGLVAACATTREGAVQAIEDWFPPSRGEIDWNINIPAVNQMLHTADSKCLAGPWELRLFVITLLTSDIGEVNGRGMVIQTYYCSASHGEQAKARLEAWENGLNGPIIT
jgi:hypothetical protein